MTPRRPTWTVAEVAQRIGRDENMAAEYLDDYRRLGMARCINGRWWLTAGARRVLTGTAPSPPAATDEVWLDDADEPYDRRPGGWVRWTEDTGWTREKSGYVEWFRLTEDPREAA
jgi:hypothetical protein